MLSTLLEWVAFGGSMLCSWLYGHRGRAGPICGLFVSVSFISFGIVAGVPAAVVSNIIFFGIHTRNLRKAMTQDIQRTKESARKALGFFIAYIWGDEGDPVGPPQIAQLIQLSHRSSVRAGWWNNINTGKMLPINYAQKLNLIRSEFAEAMEADRKNLQDDKLPHHHGIVVEIADALHRLFDLAGRMETEYDIDIARAIHGEIGHWYEEGIRESTLQLIPGRDQNAEFQKLLDRCYNRLSIFSMAVRSGNRPEYLCRAIALPIFEVLRLAAIVDEGDVATAFVDKWEFNESRPDHKIENRKSGHGKKY